MKSAAFWTAVTASRAALEDGDCDEAAARLNEARALCTGLPEQVRDARDRIVARIAERLPELTAPAPAPARPGDPLGPIAAAGAPGVSLVTCAMNRTENLLGALPSWLQNPGIDEILVVDWSSELPVAPAIAQAGFDDPRLRVIRIEDEPRWILSYAFNAGFRLACHDRILKVDADIVLAPDFVASNPLSEGTFIAGNWRLAEQGQEHVNGFFMANRADLAAVGGFNEYITTYGWDDDDLYNRLTLERVRRVDVAPGSIHHQDHEDDARLGVRSGGVQSAAEEIRSSTMWWIRRNRYIAAVMPPWDGSKTPLPLQRIPGRPDHLTRAGQPRHAVPPHVDRAADLHAMAELASWRLGLQFLDIEPAAVEALLARPFDAIDLGAVAEARTRAAAASTAPRLATSRPRLFIDAQHGLGNRLRAIGSAAAVAEATDRELVVVWAPDSHCEGRMTDLFHYLGGIVEESFVDDAAAMGCRVYNYMEVESGAEKDAPIDLGHDDDIYARAAYVLNAPPSTWEAENRFLHTLRPVEAVRDLVAGVRTPNDVSAHVRMVGGTDYEHLAYEATDNWTKEGHQLTDFWRRKSHFSHFIARIDQLVAEGRADRVFLAADKPETYDAFTQTFGDRVAYLPRTLYDRSAEQLRYALADALLLGSAPLLLGSSWSSFSELAMRLSPRKMQIEMSGKNF